MLFCARGSLVGETAVVDKLLTGSVARSRREKKESTRFVVGELLSHMRQEFGCISSRMRSESWI